MVMKNLRGKSNIKFDLEDEELLDFIWTEDEDPPTVVKGRVKKKKRKNPEKEEIN